jgi:hypothetical protein
VDFSVRLKLDISATDEWNPDGVKPEGDKAAGLDVTTSIQRSVTGSWNRIAPNTTRGEVKAGNRTYVKENI